MAFTSSAMAISANSNCSWRDKKGRESGWDHVPLDSSLQLGCVVLQKQFTKEKKGHLCP